MCAVSAFSVHFLNNQQPTWARSVYIVLHQYSCICSEICIVVFQTNSPEKNKTEWNSTTLVFTQMVMTGFG